MEWDWRRALAWRFFHNISQAQAEQRVSETAVRYAALQGPGGGLHAGELLLTLLDSLSSVGSHVKGRSSIFEYNVLIRRAGALNLALAFYVVFRWIPGIWNPSDADSRLWEFWRRGIG